MSKVQKESSFGAAYEPDMEELWLEGWLEEIQERGDSSSSPGACLVPGCDMATIQLFWLLEKELPELDL